MAKYIENPILRFILNFFGTLFDYYPRWLRRTLGIGLCIFLTVAGSIGVKRNLFDGIEFFLKCAIFWIWIVNFIMWARAFRMSYEQSITPVPENILRITSGNFKKIGTVKKD